jgi:hypothetical protein
VGSDHPPRRRADEGGGTHGGREHSLAVGVRSIIDFYRSNPVVLGVVVVVAILLAVVVLGLGSGSPLQVIALGAVGGLMAGLVIAATRR